jgi:hypothetical protein
MTRPTPKPRPVSFVDSNKESDTPEVKNITTYKNLGTEACEKLTCYKYQVIDTGVPDDTQYIWFDNKDYQLRRTRYEGKDGSVSESTYSYNKFNITVPSPVKELGKNQYLVPGDAEPQTMPDPGSMPSPVDYQIDSSADTSSNE